MKTARLLLAATAVIACLAATPSTWAQSKVGVFDPQRVSEETAEGKRIQAQLESIKNEKQKALSDKENQLAALTTQLEQQALTLSTEKRTALQVQIERLRLDLDNARKLATQELQLEVAAAQAAFNERLRRAVTSFGQSQGFDLVIEASLVSYWSTGVDVTTGIIDTFDKLGPIEGGGGQ